MLVVGRWSSNATSTSYFPLRNHEMANHIFTTLSEHTLEEMSYAHFSKNIMSIQFVNYCVAHCTHYEKPSIPPCITNLQQIRLWWQSLCHSALWSDNEYDCQVSVHNVNDFFVELQLTALTSASEPAHPYFAVTLNHNMVSICKIVLLDHQEHCD